MRLLSRLRADPILCLMFLFFAGWAVFFISMDFRPGLQKVDDGPQYLLLAKSLILGRGFSNLAMPGVPDFLVIPSAFPIMLAAYWKFVAPSQMPLYLALAAVMACGAWMAFLWLQGFLPRWQAFFVVLAFAANPIFIVLSSSVMTESPCIFLLYSGLWLSFRDMEKDGKGAEGWEGWLALLAWLILFRLRVNATPFLIVHVIMLGARKSWFKVSVAAVLAALWLWMEKRWSLPESQGYLHYDLANKLGPHRDMWAMAWNLTRGYASNVYVFASSAFGRLAFPFLYGLHSMDKSKRLAILALTAWGLWGLGILWMRYPKCRPYLIAFLFSWLPIFLQRPASIDRYMLPSLPLLFTCLLLPFTVIAIRSGTRAAGAVATFLILALVADQSLAGTQAGRWEEERKEGRDYRDVHDFINAANPKPDLLLSPRHYYSHLETGLPSIWYPVQMPYALEHNLLKDKRVWAFLFLDSPGDAKDFNSGGRYRLGDAPLYSSGIFYVYEVLPLQIGQAGPAGPLIQAAPGDTPPPSRP
jgi:hypothetical protein